MRLLLRSLACLVPFAGSQLWASGREVYHPPSVFQLSHQHETLSQVLVGVITPQKTPPLDLDRLSQKRSLLKSYLDASQSVARTEYDDFNERQKIAYLVNLHNALLLESIVKNGNTSGTRSFNDADSVRLFSDDITYLKFRLYLERKIADPRAMLALFCFEPKCPTPHRAALTEVDLVDTLTEISVKFLNDRSKNFYDDKKNEIVLSPVIKKYESAITRRYGGVRDFYLRTTNRAQLRTKNPKILFRD